MQRKREIEEIATALEEEDIFPLQLSLLLSAYRPFLRVFCNHLNILYSHFTAIFLSLRTSTGYILSHNEVVGLIRFNIRVVPLRVSAVPCTTPHCTDYRVICVRANLSSCSARSSAVAHTNLFRTQCICMTGYFPPLSRLPLCHFTVKSYRAVC